MWMLRLLPALAVAAALAWSAPLAAQAASPRTPVFSPQDMEVIRRVEGYLNSITTLVSSFVQGASTGQVARGRFFLQRPGRMRFEYDPPSPILLVADGLFLVYVDKELEQINRVPLAASPLSVLVADDVDLVGGELEVFAVERGENTMRIALRERDDPAAGSVTLTFTERPMQLRQWLIVDAQGVEVRVALLDPRTGVSIDPASFVVDDRQFETDTDR